MSEETSPEVLRMRAGYSAMFALARKHGALHYVTDAVLAGQFLEDFERLLAFPEPGRRFAFARLAQRDVEWAE